MIATQFPGRSGKQCRERWLNHLDTRVRKSAWTGGEDVVLCEAQGRLGNKWSEISKLLPGRAENAVKNRCCIPLLYRKLDADPPLSRDPTAETAAGRSSMACVERLLLRKESRPKSALH